MRWTRLTLELDDISGTMGIMIITYFGKQFIKVQLGDTVLAINPIAKNSKLKSSRFGADIAMVSLNHPDFNGIEQVTNGSKEPFVISGPGEYEINGIPIRGFSTESQYEKEQKINTIYTVELENTVLCFLGSLHSSDLADKIMGEIGGIDILFTPIGGGDVLTPNEAHKLATKLEASVIIPLDSQESLLKDFLKESGEEKIVPIDKLTIKRKDIEGKDGEIVVLKSL